MAQRGWNEVDADLYKLVDSLWIRRQFILLEELATAFVNFSMLDLAIYTLQCANAEFEEDNTPPRTYVERTHYGDRNPKYVAISG